MLCANLNIGSMFKQDSIPCHESRDTKPEYLPERKVPGHYSEYTPQRFIIYTALMCIGPDVFESKELFREFRIIFTNQCAFFHFSPGFIYGFSHLSSY